MKRRKLFTLSIAAAVLLPLLALSAGTVPKTPFFGTDFKPLSFLEIV